MVCICGFEELVDMYGYCGEFYIILVFSCFYLVYYIGILNKKYNGLIF